MRIQDPGKGAAFFDMRFTFYNMRKKNGVVNAIKLVAKLKLHPEDEDYEFGVVRIVDYPEFNKNRNKYRDTIIQEWYPIGLSGGESKQLHLLFGRYTVTRNQSWKTNEKLEPTRDNILEIALWIKTDKWIEYEIYEIPMISNPWRGGTIQGTPLGWSINEILESTTCFLAFEYMIQYCFFIRFKDLGEIWDVGITNIS